MRVENFVCSSTPSANPHAVNQYAAKATFSTELLHGNVPEAPSEASFGLA